VYALDPPAVYIHQDVMANALWRRRAMEVIETLERPIEPVVFTDAQLPAMIEQGLVARRVPMGTLDEVHDPILLFNTFRFDGRFDERVEALGADGLKSDGALRALLGYGAYNWANYNLEGDPHRHDKVCRPCWRIHLQQGCLHKCLYCGFGGLLVSSVNVEEYCEHLGEIVRRHPWQTTFLLDDDADPPCLEPEHGVLGPLMEWFGTLDGRYLIIHTKTWNTAWTRDVDHKGNTIIVWSLSGPTQSRLLEPNTGTTEQRIEAARVAQEAGIQIRYKFKPIVPVRHWREEAAEAVALLFEKTKPDVISLCVFMWMDIDELLRRLPREELDPEFRKAAEDCREEVAGTRAKPFPHHVRQAIYEHFLAEIRKHDPDIPVSISTENFAMWKALGPKLGFTPTNYVCGCGPQSTPGARKLACHPFKVAVRDDEGIPCTY